MASCIAPVSISVVLIFRQVKFVSLSPAPLAKHQVWQFRGNQWHPTIGFLFVQSTDGTKGGGNDFAAGFLLGGALFGTLGYIFAPQIRRSLLNEDEYGFRKAKRPIYYDGGLEKTRQTLNAKIRQLNSAIDNVSSRLRGGNNSPSVPVETDPEVEATM
ncbi:hypothetical protein GOBAR_AA20092 [Gossypium barbadense]|uniref:Uncharacterized protein n=1 Tax=Gossypium barbadense TaxID=3634 RepID=A0A2P5XB59_GOSBA|nr:hypothetical protein GOBAR_AA20092 [Gossypium barbadense]